MLKISALLICHNLTFHLLLKTGLCLSLLVIIIQNGSDLFSRVFNQIVSGAMDSAMVLKSEDSGFALYPTGQKQSLELKFAKFTRCHVLCVVPTRMRTKDFPGLQFNALPLNYRVTNVFAHKIYFISFAKPLPHEYREKTTPSRIFLPAI